MANNILLIGTMGSGKSSIGIRLARRLKRKFIDTDREVEKVTGLTVNEIFRRQGEIRFRSEEKIMLEKLLADQNQIIASGGTLLLTSEQYKSINGRAIIVYLKATPEEILKRVNRKKGSRPLLKTISTIEEMEAFINSRQDQLQLAEICINTSKKSLEQIVDEIVLKLELGGWLY